MLKYIKIYFLASLGFGQWVHAESPCRKLTEKISKNETFVFWGTATTADIITARKQLADQSLGDIQTFNASNKSNPVLESIRNSQNFFWNLTNNRLIRRTGQNLGLLEIKSSDLLGPVDESSKNALLDQLRKTDVEKYIDIVDKARNEGKAVDDPYYSLLNTIRSFLEYPAQLKATDLTQFRELISKIDDLKTKSATLQRTSDIALLNRSLYDYLKSNSLRKAIIKQFLYPRHNENIYMVLPYLDPDTKQIKQTIRVIKNLGDFDDIVSVYKASVQRIDDLDESMVDYSVEYLKLLKLRGMLTGPNWAELSTLITDPHIRTELEQIRSELKSKFANSEPIHPTMHYTKNARAYINWTRRWKAFSNRYKKNFVANTALLLTPYGLYKAGEFLLATAATQQEEREDRNNTPTPNDHQSLIQDKLDYWVKKCSSKPTPETMDLCVLRFGTLLGEKLEPVRGPATDLKIREYVKWVSDNTIQRASYKLYAYTEAKLELQYSKERNYALTEAEAKAAAEKALQEKNASQDQSLSPLQPRGIDPKKALAGIEKYKNESAKTLEDTFKQLEELSKSTERLRPEKVAEILQQIHRSESALKEAYREASFMTEHTTNEAEIQQFEDLSKSIVVYIEKYEEMFDKIFK